MSTKLDNSLSTLQNQTRAERKRAIREAEKSKAVFTMTREQLEKYKADAIAEAKGAWGGLAIETILTATSIVLHDEFGFGGSRLQKAQQLIESQLECVSAGTVTLSELKELLSLLNDKAKYKLVIGGK